jgi:putative SOS response-associated peptidase YedK
MCGRFYIEKDDPTEELLKIIAEIERKLKDVPDGLQIKQGEIFPTDIVPVITNSKMHTVEPFAMKWGFSKFGGTGVVINARSETAMEKSMFRQAMMERRCLIPASNYFEWQTAEGKKVKHAIRDPESPLLYMAGCYRWEKDSKLPLFVILTRDAAPGIAYIHSRMPVILPKAAREAWLSDTTDITGVMNGAMNELTAHAV